MPSLKGAAITRPLTVALLLMGTPLSMGTRRLEAEGCLGWDVPRLEQREAARRGSCLLEGIRSSSECRAGITHSPACQAVLMWRIEGKRGA